MRKLLWILLLLAAPAYGAQFAYPTSDVTDGSWTDTASSCSATDCTAVIDEGEDTPTATGTESQADYIESSYGTSGTDTYEAAIDCNQGSPSCSTPSGTAATLRFSDYLAETGGGAGSNCTLSIYVYEGATLRHTCSSTTPAKNIWNARTCTISTWSSSEPSDWSALSVRFTWNMSSSGKNCGCRISWAEFEINDAAGTGRRETQLMVYD
jgi:hypothetical protein